MPRPTMRRLAATVLVSAALTGGLAAGAGTASAAPVESLPPTGSVATLPSDIGAAIFGVLAELPTGSARGCPNVVCYGIG
ncbi:hypothetical protein [Rhodococcus tukisamuensis]|uniref:Uncharacterized protein n=1 Tax=Rhodococcus tukisamuensis TaxID=168276 RepID=A0A1G7C7U8_9NOCA|nr:hypothetical protein [Rhodococcus tukisamuensis]SDE35411.1 hypothetical protein SAMN05444580_11553 [Rhodococcus tukisamuensis]